MPGWISRWPGPLLLICLCLLGSGRTLHAQQGAFFGAVTVAGGSLEGELVSRVNDRETFRLRQLAFLQINQTDRRSIQLLALNSLPDRPGSFTEGGFAFEYMLFEWFGIGKTFAWQRGRVSNVQGYQTFLRDSTLAAMLFFPELHANAPPGLLEAAALSRKKIYTPITSSGTYDLTFHFPGEIFRPFVRVSGDPFSRTFGGASGLWVKGPGITFATLEAFVLNLELENNVHKSYPASEYGIRFGAGVRLR